MLGIDNGEGLLPSCSSLLYRAEWEINVTLITTRTFVPRKAFAGSDAYQKQRGGYD